MKNEDEICQLRRGIWLSLNVVITLNTSNLVNVYSPSGHVGGVCVLNDPWRLLRASGPLAFALLARSVPCNQKSTKHIPHKNIDLILSTWSVRPLRRSCQLWHTIPDMLLLFYPLVDLVFGMTSYLFNDIRRRGSWRRVFVSWRSNIIRTYNKYIKLIFLSLRQVMLVEDMNKKRFIRGLNRLFLFKNNFKNLLTQDHIFMSES